MPAKLDRCVQHVKKQLKAKGIGKKEAERRAWAICQSQMGKYSKDAGLAIKQYFELNKDDLVSAVSAGLQEHFNKE